MEALRDYSLRKKEVELVNPKEVRKIFSKNLLVRSLGISRGIT